MRVAFIGITAMVAMVSLPAPIHGQHARVDFVEPSERQRHATEPDTIWTDDFDKDREYFEPRLNSAGMRFSSEVKLGSAGRSMESYYARGERGVGGRKVVFGDAPFGRKLHRGGEKFDEVYWRYYVKYPVNWQGGGEAKHSRGIVFTSPRWTQACILHVWTSGDVLTLDPVRAVRDGRVMSRKYNDFEYFKWLGNSPKGKFAFHSSEELGRWVCVEVQWKLNTPGRADGIARMWVDGHLDTQRTSMDFRGTYDDHGINAVFLESYWNRGSPVDQYRWIDNFVVSTKPIGPIAVPQNPVVIPRLSDNAERWQLQVVDAESGTPVWRSAEMSNTRNITVNAKTGEFTGELASKTYLPAMGRYRFRVREIVAREQSSWSPVHWTIVVEEPSS